MQLKYCHACHGIYAYITLLRSQIGMGLGLQDLFEPDKQIDSCQKLWHLLHHDFGENFDQDLKVKGYILYLLSGEKSGETFPVKPTLEGLLLAENAPELAVKLYFNHLRVAFLSPKTQIGVRNRAGRYEWERLDLLQTNTSTPNDLTRFTWNGNCPLGEHLNSLLTPNMTDNPLVIPIYNEPQFLTIHFRYDEPGPSVHKTIEDLRWFELKGRWVQDGGWAEGTDKYHLYAVANLGTDDVRLYNHDTSHLVETTLPDPDGNIPPTLDDGVWKVGDLDNAYLLVYRRSLVDEGDTYTPPLTNIREFISQKEHQQRHHSVEGSWLDLSVEALAAERHDREEERVKKYGAT
ncbi:hypothetical protein SLS53_005469 [Cytospora paraplurivora]|uniref:Uncharacterized protein n=1 Tax=Cytospora paraplurivora TaxID=2898453 RepID=A0AAN9UDG6_9PEZI